jgi:penicillin-binding protein 2
MSLDYLYPNDRRLKLIYQIVAAAIVSLVIVLWYTQIIMGEKYASLARNNRIRRIVINAPRGLIYDRNGVLLVDNRPSFDVQLIPNEVKDLARAADQLSEILGETKKDIVKKTKLGGYLPYLPITIARDVGIDKVTIIEEQKPLIEGVSVQVNAVRNYIYNDYASHLIGHVGSISRDEYNRLKEFGYLSQDTIGKMGVEKAYDKELFGFSGGQQIQVNNKGFKDKVLSSKDPVRGTDVYLTIDKRIQDVLEAELAGKTGAVVAMDPRNGNILGYASRPGFDPNVFLKNRAGSEIAQLFRDSAKPLVDRCISGVYSPGSIFKIVVAMAALENKVLTGKTRLYCSGNFFLGPKEFKCWRAKGHGTLDVTQALKYSCNVFFYRTGVLCGSTALSNMARKFFFGEKSNIDLTPSKAGTAPNAEWKREVIKGPWVGGDTVNFAIGQGYMLVTPIQIVSMIATVANGGTIYKPTIVDKMVKPWGETVVSHPEVRGNLNASPENIATVQTGLFKAVNERDGTGGNAWLPYVKVSGKTGTVQYGPKDNKKTHAWFAGYAPSTDPEIAVAVLVEAAGSGGVNAAPIAKKVIEQYFRITNPSLIPPPETPADQQNAEQQQGQGGAGQGAAQPTQQPQQGPVDTGRKTTKKPTGSLLDLLGIRFP